MKNNVIRAGAAAALVGGLVVAAMAGPLRGHPHLKAARNAVNRALQECRAARTSRHGEFGGHRDKAEQRLLNQAKGELDAAAEFTNHR